MTNHTPGEWSVGNAGKTIYGPRQDPGEGLRLPVIICSTQKCSGVINSNERRANAQLIAAAPELLASLRVMLHRYLELVNSGDAGNWNPEGDDCVIAARAAILKAIGVLG